MDICQACLCNDRQLRPIIQMESLLKETNLRELFAMAGGVCWECYYLIKKFWKFKIQILIAQNKKFDKISLKCLSSLTKSTKSLYDYEFNYKIDPLINTEIDETKIIVIKEEYNENNDDVAEEKTNDIIDTSLSSNCNNDCLLNDDTNDFNSDENLFNEKPSIVVNDIKLIDTKTHSLKKQKEVSKKSRIKIKYNQPICEEDIKEKFTKVVYSEEQMVKNREEKRNKPNFKKIPFNCYSCVLGFMRKETYDEHVKKKHCESIGPYICDICHIRYPYKKPLEKHCMKHYVCYKCNFCNYKTVEVIAAFNHCRSKHSSDSLDRIHCQQCPMVFKNPDYLAEHISTEHLLYCNKCKKPFKGKHTLRIHMARLHGANATFVCDLCHKTFVTKSRLESHMVAHNETLAKKLAYCLVCKVQYKNIYVYRNHLKNSTNHAERSYTCPECNKKFTSKVYSTQHYNFYHLKKSRFKCEVCDKLFISAWRLKNHKQVQHKLSRSRNHDCGVCGKKFFTPTTLRAHLLTHSEQRSFMCEDCGDTFKQRPALYTHCRLVHNSGKRKK